MRWPTVGLFVLLFLLVPIASLTAEALVVRACVPNCVSPTASATLSETGTPVTGADGTRTTTLDITTGLNVGGFTITCALCTGTTQNTSRATALAIQSATVQKIVIRNTIIRLNANSTCALPCAIELRATSDRNDFPVPKPIGGYPAGVVMSGFFIGVVQGSTISASGEASGLGATGNTPLNVDVINATPGAGSGDIRQSLPASCAGRSDCKFVASLVNDSFSESITETVQQTCASGVSSCQTWLRTRVNVSMANRGDAVDLPVESDASMIAPGTTVNGMTQTDSIIAETTPPFLTFSVPHLLIDDLGFAVHGRFRLDLAFSDGINPPAENVLLRVGSFTLPIPAGKFRRFLNGKNYSFAGTIKGLKVALTFQQDRTDPTKWTFVSGVKGVDLTSLGTDPLSVQLDIGADTGTALATPKIF